MADRLAELLRQRALLQEHLAWLDAEIAAASNRDAPRPRVVQYPPSPVAPLTVATQILAAATPARPAPVNPQSAFGSEPVVADTLTASSGAAGEEILEQYRSSPDSLKTDVRKGCFLYFAAALLILGLAVFALWFAFRSDHAGNDLQPPAKIPVERRP